MAHRGYDMWLTVTSTCRCRALGLENERDQGGCRTVVVDLHDRTFLMENRRIGTVLLSDVTVLSVDVCDKEATTFQNGNSRCYLVATK